jgi:subtilase family serine protease
MGSILRVGLVAAGLLALAACSSGAGSGTPPTASLGGDSGAQSAAYSGPGLATLPGNLKRACPVSLDEYHYSCEALVQTDVAHPLISGLTPANLQSAYNLPSSTQGTGQTVAVVDAFDDPNAEADLGVYRSNFGLPACTTANGCFKKLNERGQPGPYPAPDAGWATEISLDLDMVSAGCPNCNIMLVEAKTNSLDNLGKSVDEAVRLGAAVVSNSYSGGGTHGSQYYDHKGVVILASAGDGGYGIGSPAGFPTVVSVGGTTLKAGSGSRGWIESTWHYTGSGCEKTLAKPKWQTDKGCKGRTANDVSAVAADVAAYDTYQTGGWIVLAGTSVSSPLVASIYGLAGNASSQNAAESLYAPGASLYDITTGDNGVCTPPNKDAYLCTAEVGYDGPTGNGTPNGVGAF